MVEYMFARLKSSLHALLRQSEAYTKTDMLYATQGGFWLTLGKAIGLCFSLLFAVAMANLIPREIFGTYKFVLSGAAIVGSFSLLGMGSAIIQAVSRGFEGALRQCVKEYFKWSFGVVGASIAVAVYYFLNGNSVLAISFLIVGACNPIITGFSFFSQFLSGKKDFKLFSIYDPLRNIVPALILIGTVFFTSDPVLIVLVFFVSSALINILLYYSTIQQYRPNDTNDPRTVSYGKHLSVIGVIGKIAGNIDSILVFHYLGAAQLAIYAFAQTPINNLKLLNDIPAKLALPKLTQRGLPELRASLPRKVLLLVLLMFGVAALYIAAAPFVFRILFPQYMSSVVFSQVLALTLVLAPGSMFGEVLTAHMKKRELYTSQITLPLARIALLFILLPLFGIWGAIGATFASQSLMFILYAFQFWRAREE